MSAHHSKILLGRVIGTGMMKTAKVRVERLVLDKYVMQYYPKRTTVFAHDAQEEAKEGDIVLVKQLTLPRSKHVKYLMDRIIYSQGNVTDPITRRKCDGSSYWEEAAPPYELDGDGLPRDEVVEPSSSTDTETERHSEGTAV
ncbi:28S ribosomal protein S17, mitochondrial-like [Acanthaster planci]|uniref:28S ribosomal protein S17, mitochondrial-like n=1 Tax=Acanthaster planci TaxID=133434 RepID=A0A8B7XQQ0_ACAPL|nr:28S ribosomal protein S17, mitochondrial-like [Acanthaster planci]